ncbi:hypothetical protein N8I77_005097 [Diaporthe amygdali]|uniref:Uncharacterized protein n=1 Tax=Phomopsis amygdali TaxID=1214568 RepID=A0AAD9SM98_PHOAM|nr:hypothetical protein N8I77_005097 [Diaporthe amygdali]
MSASLLVLLASTALADCNTDGASWSDIGDDDAITKAISDLCSHMAGDYEIGSRVEYCANVKKNRINARIDISQQPENGTMAVPLYKEVCEDLLGQAGCHASPPFLARQHN